MESLMFDQQRSDQPANPHRPSGLYEPGFGLEERGGYEGHVFESSPYTKMAMHPLVAGAVALGATIAVAKVLRSATREP
jgi:hypothetical protein